MNITCGKSDNNNYVYTCAINFLYFVYETNFKVDNQNKENKLKTDNDYVNVRK